MINKYSLKTHGNKKLSQNFKVLEFSCHDGSDEIYIDSLLVDVLQKIREHFRQPVNINSAYRTPSYNLKVGGVSNSQHTKGTAADIVVKGISPKEVAQYAEFVLDEKGGIGLYDSFVHIDTRSARSRWQNFGKEVAVSGFYGYAENKIKNPADAISVLNKKGIIDSPDLWYGGRWNNDHVKQLLVKVANYISRRG